MDATVPVESNLAEELTCSVCYDLLSDPVMLDCMHHFCRTCIMRFWDSTHREPNCPQCRRVIPNRFVRSSHLLQKVVDLVKMCSSSEHHRKIQKDLKEILKARETMLGTLAQKKEEVEKKISTVEETGQNIRCHITEEFQHLHNILIKEEKALLSSVEMEQKEAVSRLQDIVHSLDQQLDDLSGDIAFIKETLSKTGDSFFLEAQVLKKWPPVSVESPVLDNCDLFNKYKGPFQYMMWRRMFKYINPVPEPLTFDTTSAHPSLMFSKDLRSVSDSEKRPPLLPVGEKSRRFAQCVNVLGSQAFYTGRHYWEVWVGNKTKWDLGVASSCVDRKVRVKLTPQNGYWTIRMRDWHKYVAATVPWTCLLVDSPLKKIGVYLDCGEETVSFFNADSMVHLFTFKGAQADGFYPFFSTGFHDGAKNAEPMRICHFNL
ncbi:nuclear factor 7, brain-like [Rhinophrynus dorsalis]